MRFILLLLGTIALTGCDSNLLRVPPPPIGPQLTGDEIKSALTGNSLVAVEKQVPPLSFFFAENGKLRGNSYRDSGTWGIRNDTLCGKWRNWYGTLSSCWEIFHAGTRFTLKNISDTRTLLTTLTPGNVVDK